MDKNKKGIVYTVTHKESGKVYVGVTTQSLEKRKKDHIQKARNNTGHYFQNAVATCGSECFEWKSIDTASSLDDLAQKEKHYINKYNSFQNGFNSDRGGSLKKTVYQYSIIENGKLVRAHKSLEDAAEAMRINKKSISRACLNVNNIYKGYYWSYTLTDPFVPSKDMRRKMVQQYDLEGNLLATYISIAEASRQTGLSKSPIAKTCRGEQKMTGGYIWVYTK